MSLPIYQDQNKNMMFLQTNWATQLNPVIQKEIVQGILLKNISLLTGANIINHKLSRQMQGWMVSDIDAAVSIYRSQPLNDKTLTLTSSGAATISLWVF